MKTKDTLKTLSETTLTNALRWANRRFSSEAPVSKEETILLERIVMVSADLVAMTNLE
ncbi:hypothetical protein [Paenibacillus brevis]|uniref:Uncharacterized protein n=1 Tax=Paenibacillus brevis TaxID=2841508 RepID=A0ABS6FR09_9BACL|nr:hypothetical protein [Paenibacillus brevis]MBU5672672.1 hypothetical protein [Paenibacillus brevis]